MTLRIVGALAALISALVHWWEWGFNGYNWWAAQPLSTIGALFVVNGVAGVVIAILLVTWRRHWFPLFLLFGFGLLTAAGYVTSTVLPNGLFGDKESWTGFLDWVAFIVEIVAIIVALVAFARERSGSRTSAITGTHAASA